MDDLQKHFDRWKKELRRTARSMSRWSMLSRVSLIKPLAEHRLACDIIFAFAIIRKLQDDYNDTKALILKHYGISRTCGVDLSALEVEFDTNKKMLPVIKYKFKGDETFVRHRAIAAYYNIKNCKATFVNARTLCNQVIHSYIWTMVYCKGRLLGVAISSDENSRDSLYIVKITDIIDCIEYYSDSCLPAAYKLSIAERKLKLYELLLESN